ncbi:UNVERIFIED_CONTAM: hypothetical protein RMT77_000781 [Armadillidium vulgare]
MVVKALFNPRNSRLLKVWFPSAVTFGASASILFIYFTEWKVVTRKIPFYGSKYD